MKSSDTKAVTPAQFHAELPNLKQGDVVFLDYNKHDLFFHGAKPIRTLALYLGQVQKSNSLEYNFLPLSFLAATLEDEAQAPTIFGDKNLLDFSLNASEIYHSVYLNRRATPLSEEEKAAFKKKLEQIQQSSQRASEILKLVGVE